MRRDASRPKRERNGRYAIEQRCDACAQPIRGEHYTDDEVCQGSDDPGFFLCGRKRCCTIRDKYPSVEGRRALYTYGRWTAEHLGSDEVCPHPYPQPEVLS